MQTQPNDGVYAHRMVLGWPIGGDDGRAQLRAVRGGACASVGGALLPFGAVAFMVLAPCVSPWIAGIGSLVMGFGMGFLSTAAIIIIQQSLGWTERGSATASNVFSRNLVSTRGAAFIPDQARAGEIMVAHRP